MSPSNLLICCGGFEDRSIAYVESIKNQSYSTIVIIRYDTKESQKSDAVDQICRKLTSNVIFLTFNRFEPTEFDIALQSNLIFENFDSVTIDTSAMSKLLIMILIVRLRSHRGEMNIVYSEPESYAPNEAEFEKFKDIASRAAMAPSTGVRNVVRCPSLSSLVMQRYPSCLIAFLSFNEQLVRALIYSINPSKVLLVGIVPPLHSWRAQACTEIHSEIISEYKEDNPISADGLLERRTSTLDYRPTLKLIDEIYAENEKTFRLILSPTGSKMQAVACALAKIKYPEIHIEYPTPDSFSFADYSSPEIRKIHQFKINLHEVVSVCPKS